MRKSDLPGASRADAPTLSVLRIGPEKVAHGTIVGDLLLPINCADLVQGLDGGGKTTVDAEDLKRIVDIYYNFIPNK